MDKVVPSARDAVADITDGSTLAVGGFGLCGIPDALIAAIGAGGATNLEVFSNNCGVDDYGLGILVGGPDPAGPRLVRRGEQGIRPAVPGRGTRGGADPAGHVGRTPAGRRGGYPGVLHPGGGVDPDQRRWSAVAVRVRRFGGMSPPR
ncbi:probable CoA-transferase (plasmid) [Rhodococcus jostii RHA1]|uniref:Probable CoA-transferase n=1 Tax=Rhodococcus jostii (strain RHA1) TaxID=101510 RepID=Q0RWI6_RHOJR|nr:probable CoA-transferase [Rhodococcus jostii RHA1]